MKLYNLNCFIRKSGYSTELFERRKIIFENSNKFRHLFDVLSLIILFVARCFYIKSLSGCDGEEFECVFNNDLKYISDDIYYCTHSVIYFLIFLFIFHLKLCSCYQLFIFILIILELIYKDTGNSFLHHGIINIVALFILMLLGELFILILILIINLYKKKKYVQLKQILIIIYLLSIIIFVNSKHKYFCEDWAKGLNGTYILNDKTIHSCSINIPHNKCLIDIFSPLLDFSNLLKINCSERKENEKYLLKSFSKLNNSETIKKIGFPITIGEKEEIKGKPPMYAKTLVDFVKNNLINLDDKNQTKFIEQIKKPEVYVDFSNDSYGKLKINLHYSNKLSKKRQLLSEKNDSKNILFIFLDNLSRVHFYRQFKKTSSFLKKFLSFEGFSTKNNPNQKYHGFEFMKYHNFKRATLQNSIPMFSGVYYDKENHMVSIVKKMKEVGYITGNVQDVCHKELMGIGTFEKYSFIEFDHEYAAPNCDPNVYKYGYGYFDGENGILRKCLYGKDSIEHAFEYGKQFWKAYKNNKKFLRIVNTYAHEYTGEKAKYSDDAMYLFLKDLFFSNQLVNTTIFIAGDHGFALMGVYKLLNPNDWRIEQSLPIFILINSDNNNLSYEKEYSEILKNQQTLITPFDIYYTIRYIIFRDRYKINLYKEQKNEGECLFKYINPKERNCSKYKDFGNCQCELNEI